MPQRALLASLFLFLLLPALAVAQKVELTPFVGYRFGGQIDENANFLGREDFDVDDGKSAGLILGFAVTRGLQVELIWSHQATRLFRDRGLFDPGAELFDIDLDYYHAGVAYQWTLGQVRPFVGASVGATELDPEEPGLSSATRFSIGIGGGVKLMFTHNLGLRFEGRLLATDLVDDDEFCRRRCRNDDLTQGELRGGLVLAF